MCGTRERSIRVRSCAASDVDRRQGPDHVLAGIRGQTVLRKQPTGMALGATLQLLDHATLQQMLSVPVAYDFRSMDVAAGGQSAPPAPAYHGWFFYTFPGPRDRPRLRIPASALIQKHT